VRLTTYHPCSAERQEIRDLNLPGPPWAISTACYGRDLYLYLFYTSTLWAVWFSCTELCVYIRRSHRKSWATIFCKV